MSILHFSRPFLLTSSLRRRRMSQYISLFTAAISVNYTIEWNILKLLRRCQTRWPRGLGRESEATLLLGLRGRIPPVVWVSLLSVVCRQVEVSATG